MRRGPLPRTIGLSSSRRRGCAGRTAPWQARFPGLQRTADRFGSRSGLRPFGRSRIRSQRIKDASTVDTSGVAGRGHVGQSALAETALARKFKYPKGLNRHYTLRIGAL